MAGLAAAAASELASLGLSGGEATEGHSSLLPPKPWESIATESGATFCRPTYQHHSASASAVSESHLVGLVLNALQGVKSELHAIDRLCEAFSSDPADRTFHRIPTLWHRSSSKNAFAKILSSLARSGLAFFLLRQFVDYFHAAGSQNQNGGEDKSPPEFSGGAAASLAENENGERPPPHTLVNQAFAIAVGKVLQGYICALNTLSSSMQLRHAGKDDANSQQNGHHPAVGCLTSVVHTDMSVLEVYLHTKVLTTRIQALANLCFFNNGATLMSFRDALNADITLLLCSFPRGAQLLTYLYAQLRDADPVHHALLEFLFVRSFEPYYGFIKSWIYQARFCDPYKEFVTVYEDEASPCLQGKAEYHGNLSSTSVKEQHGLAVPCFLNDVRLPLLRAGQQLQVLVKLLDMCNFSSIVDDVHIAGDDLSSHLSNLEDILPYWNDSSSDPTSCLFPLAFNKRSVEAMVLKRELVYKKAQEKLTTLLPRLSLRCQHISSTVFPYCMVPSKALVSDEELIYSPTIADKQTMGLDASEVDTDASSISDDFSSDTELSASSSCLSLNIFEGKTKSYGSTELRDIFFEAHPRLLPGFSDKQSISQRHGMKFATEMNSYQIHSVNGFIDYCPQDKGPTQLFDLSQFQSSNLCRKSQISGANYLFSTCWPLGGLLQNPFSFGGHASDENAFVPNCNLKVIDRKMESLETEDSHFAPISFYDSSELDLSLEKNEFKENRCGGLTEPQNPWRDSKILSMNSFLAKNVWFHMRGNLRDENPVAIEKSSFTCFDFSSVEDPCKAYKERFNARSDHGIQVDFPVSSVPSSCSLEKTTNSHGIRCHDSDAKVSGQIDQSVLCSPAFSSDELIKGQKEKHQLTSNSGGANWESLLSYSSETGSVDAGGCRLTALARYKYVSGFTINLLEEGFDLRGHLLALRRYHLMELADWADSFIMSLWYHKWHVAEADQRVSEVQALLDLALQRSSCESDQYKERLFASIKGQGMMLPPTSPSSKFLLPSQQFLCKHNKMHDIGTVV
ncbi:hypothetical protein ACLOJK_040814 [Asimina triloba]